MNERYFAVKKSKTTGIKWPKDAGSCEEENGIFDEKMTNGKKLNEYKI